MPRGCEYYCNHLNISQVLTVSPTVQFATLGEQCLWSSKFQVLPSHQRSNQSWQARPFCTGGDQNLQTNRIRAFLFQSSDKNLMVPVGGAIVAGPDQRIVQAVASSYPGR